MSTLLALSLVYMDLVTVITLMQIDARLFLLDLKDFDSQLIMTYQLLYLQS